MNSGETLPKWEVLCENSETVKMVAEINAAQEISYILRDPFPVLYFYYPAVFPKIAGE